MAKYSIGDVVLVNFPFCDKNETKVRPAIVFDVGEKLTFLFMQCTSTNRSGRIKGIWVTCKSTEGKEMGLVKDTFINATNTIELNEREIRMKIGDCPFMDDLHNLLNGE